MANAWGELSWNSGLWGQQSDAIATPTGLGLNSAQGEAGGFPFPGWGALGWSSGVWGNVQNSGAEVTGFGLTTNSGNVGVSGEINEGWGRLTYGENAWGIAGDVLVTGIGLNVGIGTGSVTIDVQPELLGEQVNLSTGDPSIIIATEIFLNENPLPNLTITEGTADAAPDAEVTGNQLNVGVGTVTAFNEQGWGRDDWGTEVWGAQGIWTSVSLTGFNLGVTSGIQETWGQDEWGATTTEWGGSSVTEVDILTIASPSGIELTAAEGIVDPSPDATVIGIGLTASVAVGSVVEADANVVINNDILPTFTAEADAQLSTAQAKFGPSSLLLDGTGDFVQSTASDVVQNNFTIEFFAYASNFAQDAYLWDNSLSNQGFAISITSAGQLRLIQDNTILQQTSSPSLNNNQWNHFALVQNGSLLNLYINGTSKLQYATGGDSYPGQSYKIGTNEGETQFFNGYIDEFRSSDIARYTTTFTPPTSAFTADGNTISLLHFDGANGSTNIVNSTGSDIPRIALGLGQGQAELEAVTIAEPTGQQLNISIGTAVAGASAEVFPTGIGLTATVNSINVQSWQIVDTGSSVTWNVIDTAA